MELKDVKHTVKLQSDIGVACQVCGDWKEASDIDARINHLLQQHGYQLLHVGSEASRDDEGKQWSSTVAVLGSAEIPPEREPLSWVPAMASFQTSVKD